MIGAAVGINGDVAARSEALLDAGIDVLVVDTAHGHQDRMVESLKSIREVRDRLADPGRRVSLVAGNVVSTDGVNDLVSAGADVVKGGSRTRCHVYHPDDDRRRPAAVQRCAGMRGRRSVSGPIDLGGRWRSLPARRRTCPGRWSEQCHDRLVVCGDV